MGKYKCFICNKTKTNREQVRKVNDNFYVCNSCRLKPTYKTRVRDLSGKNSITNNEKNYICKGIRKEDIDILLNNDKVIHSCTKNDQKILGEFCMHTNAFHSVNCFETVKKKGSLCVACSKLDWKLKSKIQDILESVKDGSIVSRPDWACPPKVKDLKLKLLYSRVKELQLNLEKLKLSKTVDLEENQQAYRNSLIDTIDKAIKCEYLSTNEFLSFFISNQLELLTQDKRLMKYRY